MWFDLSSIDAGGSVPLVDPIRCVSIVPAVDVLRLAAVVWVRVIVGDVVEVSMILWHRRLPDICMKRTTGIGTIAVAADDVVLWTIARKENCRRYSPGQRTSTQSSRTRIRLTIGRWRSPECCPAILHHRPPRPLLHRKVHPCGSNR